MIIVDTLITIPIDCAGSQGYCKITATQQTDFDIRKNDISVGIIRWLPGTNSPVFINASPILLTVGDRLEVIASSIQDPTLASIGLTLKGIKQ